MSLVIRSAMPADAGLVLTFIRELAEYEKLLQDVDGFLAGGSREWEALQLDIERTWAYESVIGYQAVADFSRFTTNAKAQVPRLIDGVVRYTAWQEREWAKLKRDVAAFARRTGWEAESLRHDVERYGRAQVRQIPLLMAEVERFFDSYEREQRPLADEVKRFWRPNIASGYLLLPELKRFFEHTQEETAELELGIRRFIGHGGVEWTRLQASVKRFVTFSGAAFGDQAMPSPVTRPAVIFDDYQVPRGYNP